MSVDRRRLEAAGYRFEPSAAGKHFWRHPATGSLLPEERAVALVWQAEARQLEEWGWERVEVEGEVVWRRPGSGRLYPRGAAYDVMLRMHGEEPYAGERIMSSELELERLRRAVERLMSGQQEALEAIRQALEGSKTLTEETLVNTLVNLGNILQNASEDARSSLEPDGGDGT